MTGILSFMDYGDAIFNEDLNDIIIAKDLATSDVVTVTTDDNLFTAFEKISVKDFSILPVVAPGDPERLVGIVTRRDIMGAYNKAVIKKAIFDN